MTDQPTPNPSAPGGKGVLVVDDNVSSAETLALLISLSGHSTQVVHSGMAALEAVAANPPDVILLDIGLPGMDGFEVARRVRQTDPDRRIILVAVTGYGQEEDRRKSLEAGFNHHLVKPVDLNQLESILASTTQPAPV